MNMVIASLKRLALTPDDIIILAVDSREGSWRKEVDKNYKSNRKEQREKQTDIDWDYMFEKFNALLRQLDLYSPFILIEIPKLEADDVMAAGAQFFKDNEVILVTHDSDMEMLSIYKNVKIFSPISKKFKKTGNPYHLLAKKIKKETVDNLITPILTKEDYDKRMKIVNLIDLPEKIKNKVFDRLEQLNFTKDYDLSKLGIIDIKKRFLEIYNNHIPIEKEKKKLIIKQKKLF